MKYLNPFRIDLAGEKKGITGRDLSAVSIKVMDFNWDFLPLMVISILSDIWEVVFWVESIVQKQNESWEGHGVNFIF